MKKETLKPSPRLASSQYFFFPFLRKKLSNTEGVEYFMSFLVKVKQ